VDRSSSQDIKDPQGVNGEPGAETRSRGIFRPVMPRRPLATCRVKVSIACYIIHTSLMATCLTSSCYCRQGHFSVFSLARRINISSSLCLARTLSVLPSPSISSGLRKQIAALIAFLINCCGWLARTICSLSLVHFEKSYVS